MWNTPSSRIDKAHALGSKELNADHAELFKLPVAEAFIVMRFHCAGGAQRSTALKGVGVMASQRMDLPSLTPFYADGWGRLLLGIVHWATSVALPGEVVENLPHKWW